MTPATRLASLAAAATLVLSIGACGSDDDSTSSATETTKTEDAGLTPEQTAACDALIEAPTVLAGLQGEDPDKKTILQMQELSTTIAAGTTGPAQAAAQGTVDTITEAMETKNMRLLDSDEFLIGMLAPWSAGREQCGYKAVDFKVKEMKPDTPMDTPMYHYVGIPKELAAGTYSFGMDNPGKAFHEALVFRLSDDFTGTLEEFVQLPDQEAFSMVDGAPTVTFVPPGASGYLNADLSRPGRYIIYCHIPLEDKDHQPVMGEHGPIWHFLIGMVEEVTVS